MIATKPLNADDWRAYARENGLLAGPMDINDPMWAALTVEVARWYAVAAWAETAVSGQVLRYLHSLKEAGGYPCTLDPDCAPVTDDDVNAAMDAHTIWLDAAQPLLAGAILNAEAGLRAEAQAATWREQPGTIEGSFIDQITAR